MSNKLAAIDIGTNSFHLVVVQILENGKFEVVDAEKEVLRLSEGITSDKKITEESIAKAIDVLNKFAGIAKIHDAEIKAVATSAVRESANKVEFLEQIKRETGINIEVINGVEEGRLIYWGVLQSVPVYDKRILCIDIGGGSTEFVVGYKGKILYANSLKIGAVRLTKMFFQNYEINSKSIKKCTKWVAGELYPVLKLIKNYNIDIVVGSSGTIMATGLMVKALYDSDTSQSILNNYKFSNSGLAEVREMVLTKKTILQRKKIKGLDAKRADIIPAGIIIISTIFEQLNINELTISGYALREGIIIDAINKRNPDKIFFTSNIRKESAEKLAISCNYDYKHCVHVSKLAGVIFDQLLDLHQLNKEYKEYLIIASMLHDIGYHIAHSKHHIHSQYIIVNSELLGFNENEIRAIACIARYHRKSHPKTSHNEFMLLPEDWKIIVKKLSAILRIADAFDRTHNFLIQDVKVKSNIREVIFYFENKLADVEIELWSLERRKKLFETLFEKEIKVKSLR